MRVVIDTSSLVRMVAGKAGLRELRLATNAGLEVIVSIYLLAELERTLLRRLHRTKQQAHRTRRTVTRLARTVVVHDIIKMSRDPNDDPIIALAVQADADFLVSSDKDILEIKKIGSVEIIDYAAFIRVLAVEHR